jgi:hypothetical protein
MSIGWTASSSRSPLSSEDNRTTGRKCKTGQVLEGIFASLFEGTASNVFNFILLPCKEVESYRAN